MGGLLGKAINIYRTHGLWSLICRASKFIRKNPKYLHYSITNLLFRLKYGNGIDVMEEDWDNLIILDACRFDAFSDCNSIDGTLQSRVSIGSSSLEFIEENFSGRTLHDTVYVTANPYVTEIEDDVFHAVISLLDEWDEEFQTVMPEKVVEATMDAHKKYPEKRLIIHFMQPHIPYIGEKGQKLEEEIQNYSNVKGWTKNIDETDESDGIKIIKSPLIEGIDITEEDLFEAYKETLGIVLKHTQKLVETLDGKTIVTADHGELFGERIFPLHGKKYGHPTYLRTAELCLVPWLIIDSDSRRNIVSDEPVNNRQPDIQDLERKLHALGYK